MTLNGISNPSGATDNCGQLELVDGVLCRHYVPGPASDHVTVPILPASLHQQALLRNT